MCNGDRFFGGTTVSQYHVSWFFNRTTDVTLSSNNCSPGNNARGRTLFVTQNWKTQRQFIARGEVIGRVGAGVVMSDIAPRDANGNHSFTAVADINFAYQPIAGNYPAAM